MKGAVREAPSAYHTRQSQDDHCRCLPLGSICLWSASADCPTLCPLRATSPGAGVPGIGILSDTARKNGWQVAEHAPEGRPDGMHRLLSHAAWDTNGVRAYALEHLGRESAILVIDETSFPKQGHKSAGVAMQ
jgi:DDE superfamily endonuclease